MSMCRRRNLAWFAAIVFVALFGAAEFIGWVRAAWTVGDGWGIDVKRGIRHWERPPVTTPRAAAAGGA